MALRDDIRNAMIAAGFDPDDTTSATSPKYNARLFEAIAGVVSAGMAGSVDWSTLTEYKTAGTRSVTVPQGCDRIIIFGACAGGGGGGASKNGTCYSLGISASVQPGCSGGGGAFLVNKVFPVTQGTTLSVVVGNGGTKGTYSPSSNSTAGGTTSINGLFTLGGGKGGPSGMVAQVINGGTSGGDYGINGGAGLNSYQAHPRIETVSSGRSFSAPAIGQSLFGIQYGCGGLGGDTGISGSTQIGADGKNGGSGYVCFAFIRKAA